MVLWLIGKSGSGKSEIGKKLYNRLKTKKNNFIYIDGDDLRRAICWDLGHSIVEREKSEKIRSNLCYMLSKQNISIVCSALSNSPKIRLWNKINIPNYHEVYLNVNYETLLERDSKGLYKKYSEGKISNIVGLDIPFYEPDNPLLEIKNDGSMSPDIIVDSIMQKLKKIKN